MNAWGCGYTLAIAEGYLLAISPDDEATVKLHAPVLWTMRTGDPWSYSAEVPVRFSVAIVQDPAGEAAAPTAPAPAGVSAPAGADLAIAREAQALIESAPQTDADVWAVKALPVLMRIVAALDRVEARLKTVEAERNEAWAREAALAVAPTGSERSSDRTVRAEPEAGQPAKTPYDGEWLEFDDDVRPVQPERTGPTAAEHADIRGYLVFMLGEAHPRVAVLDALVALADGQPEEEA